MRTLSIVLGTALALGLASPAVAAQADYYLIIDGVEGESTTAAKIESWSFGASQPATTTSGASGKSSNPLYTAPVGEGTNPLATTEHSVKSPRDAASGLATGRSSGGKVEAVDDWERADTNRDGKLDFAEADKLAETGPLSLTMPAGSDAAGALCGKTDHLRSGHIVSSTGASWDLATMKGARCTATGGGGAGGMVTVALTGSMKHTKSGHVTLMK